MNIYAKLRLYLCAVLVVFVSTSFQNVESRKLIVYKPAKDFSFITTYYCIYDLFGEEQWTKNTGRSFDKNGVHLTNNAYHPVNACHYALFCYDEYKKTGDEKFKKAMLAQVSYLRDSTKYHEVDGYKVGYPYLNSWHDLKAPWYSALAQSEAISVLVRYYALTNDKTILPLIVKLKNFMIAPQTDGKGTLSYTPEGNIWFEEYPNSPQERQVLNGFFLALVALHDYTHLFPDDEEAKDLYAKAIVSAKESVKFYDTGSWLKYNRGDQRLVANGYMKWQVLEMKLVYEVTKDEFFRNLFKLWAVYGYDKSYETPGCKIPHYDYAVPLVQEGSELVASVKPTLLPLSPPNASISSSCFKMGNENAKLIDDNPKTFVTCTVNELENKIPYFELVFRESTPANGVRLFVMNKDVISKGTLKLSFSDNSAAELKPVQNISYSSSDNEIDLVFPEQKITKLRIDIESLQNGSQLNIGSMQVTRSGDKEIPPYLYYKTKPYKAGTNRKFEVKSKDMEDFTIFYKSSHNESLLSKEVWHQGKIFYGDNHKLDDENEFFQFLIIAKPVSDKARISSIKFGN